MSFLSEHAKINRNCFNYRLRAKKKYKTFQKVKSRKKILYTTSFEQIELWIIVGVVSVLSFAKKSDYMMTKFFEKILKHY